MPSWAGESATAGFFAELQGLLAIFRRGALRIFREACRPSVRTAAWRPDGPLHYSTHARTSALVAGGPGYYTSPPTGIPREGIYARAAQLHQFFDHALHLRHH